MTSLSKSKGADGKETPKMKYKRLGSSGLMVSEICLGAMTFSLTGKGGWGLPAATENDSHAMLDAYIEAGGNFIDTADVYTDSETVIGNWLSKKKNSKQFRKSIVIATKFKNQTGEGPNDKGASRKHIFDAVDASLSRLQTDYIDLYQIHLWDNNSELRETLSALNDLVRQGKVHYIGCSNYTAWQMQKAVDMQEKYGWERFYTVQQQYSLLMRNLEWDITDVCLNEGIGILPWSPLAGGWLSGKYKRGDEKPAEGGRVEWAQSVGWDATSWDKKSDQTFNILDELEKIGKDINQPVSAVALRWLMQRPAVSSTIIGASNMNQLKQNLAAARFTLTDEQMRKLDEASNVAIPYPYSMIKGNY